MTRTEMNNYRDLPILCLNNGGSRSSGTLFTQLIQRILKMALYKLLCKENKKFPSYFVSFL